MAPRAVELDEAVTTTERKEIFYEGYLYDVTDWIPKHPGGRIIDYYTDEREDATLAIQQFHQRSLKQILARMKAMPKRPAENNNRVSQSERHQKLTHDYQALYNDFLEKGLFEPSPSHVFRRLFETFFYFGLGLYILWSDLPFSRAIAIFFFSCFGSRCGFLMHEGGHGSMTGNPKYDRWFEALTMTLGIGFSSTWWSSQHNRHHAMPQRVHRDIDLETLPLLAFNPKIALDDKNGNNFFTRNQAKLFLTIDVVLVALFWKFYLNPKYVIFKRQWSQILILALHYYLAWTLMGPVNYFFVIWFASAWMFGTFTLSHSHLPVTTDSLHWVEYSLLHTVDVEPSWWCDWAMGYLNYQIEHHLFPTMPQFRGRQIIPQIKELAEKNGIPYRCISYVDAIKAAFKNLAHVSEEIVKTHVD